MYFVYYECDIIFLLIETIIPYLCKLLCKLKVAYIHVIPVLVLLYLYV